MIVIILHITLGILLFYIINNIGHKSYSVGYMSISIFVKNDRAPAFNFLIRVLTPIVYIILVSSILYALNLDKFVKNIYLVNVYYLVFRLLFNQVIGRGLLLNYKRRFVYWLVTIIFSYFAYVKIISIKRNVIPDFSNLSNELWILIIIFIYQIFNQVEKTKEDTHKRKDNYIIKMYKHFKKKYCNIIDDNLNNDYIKGLIYTILIYENFNRPKFIRIFENLHFYITRKPHTLGVMQVYSQEMISDKKSIELGIEIIKDQYKKLIKQYEEQISRDYFYDAPFKEDLISVYNKGKEYAHDIMRIWDKIMIVFYGNTQDSLTTIQDSQ